MSEQVQQETTSAVATEPSTPLFDPATSYTYIPWRMLDRATLEDCVILKNLVDNKKFNPKAQGQSIWAKFSLKKFKLRYPGMKIKLNDDKLCFRTPFMNTPFGISKWADKEGLTISLSFGRAKDEEVEAFAEWAQNVFDAFMIEKVTQNAKAWLGTVGNHELIKAVYTGLHRFTEEDDEKGYAPKTPGFKLLTKKDTGAMIATGHRGDINIPITVDHVKPNDYLQLDVELSTLWFLKPTCGISCSIARLEHRTGEEMMNPGYVCNPPKPAETEQAPPQSDAPPAEANAEVKTE